MNEGESAGGGHQGSCPAPPAVSDRRSTLPAVLPPSSSTSSSVSNATNLQHTPPSIITIATTNTTTQGSPLGVTVTAAASSTSRSFPQSIAQQHSSQQSASAVVPSKPTVLAPTTTSALTALNQKQQQLLHMPQTTLQSTDTQLKSQGQTQSQTISSSSQIASTASSHVTAPIGAGGEVAESPPLAKRQKLNSGQVSVSSASILKSAGVADSAVAAVSTSNDREALQNRILQQRSQLLRRLKEKHSENVAELFYLQTGGNMMDFPAWRKKPPTPQYINFSNAYRLDQLVNEERAAAAVQQQQTADNIATIIGIPSGSHHIQAQAQSQSQPQAQAQVQQSQLQLLQEGLVTVSASASSTSTIPSTPSVSTSAVATTTTSVTTAKANKPSAQPEILSINSAASVTSPRNSSNLSVVGAVSNDSPKNTDADVDILPQGAEIKIPAAGATPVAVSTKLPAAVVQLTQQGGTPLVPCNTGTGSVALRRNGNGNGISSQSASSSTGILNSGSVGDLASPPALFSSSPSGLLVPASLNGAGANASGLDGPGGSLASQPTATTAVGPSSSAQEFSFKAKQEVYVMQRISELQREGLWTEKRLPKLQEPSRPKAHWDYLLEEMVWLAADFAQERKWKKNAAKKCARMVQKYFQDKANAAQKAEKAQEAHLKRIAAFISKEVKMFWSNVEKLVEYKHHTKLEEKRKKALDQHLSFIVDQTEKFSQQLAEGMNKSIVDASAAVSAAPSMESSRISSPKREAASISDDDFHPESGSEDDEETIAKAEEEAVNVKEEVAALEKESQMELDDFIKDLPKGYLENRDKIILGDGDEEDCAESGNKEEEDDEEFEADEASEDDENTISKQEEKETDVDHKKEIDELEADNDLTVEQLLEKYKLGKIHESEKAKAISASSRKVLKMDVDSDDDDGVDDDDSEASESGTTMDENDGETNSDEMSSEENDENEQSDGLKTLLEDNDGNNSKDDMIKDAAALAESIQPKGNTLSSTNVVTPVPFLLKHSLREYQHIGLDWLVTMNERKLNGILADEMGLGKTIQTIALLAHLACVKGNWGPHLIVVPSSVMLNWEMEFKKWCPGFKILTYYGTQKERKLKRVGWTKPNAFHVCITSYKLVVQDQQSFRRKKWKYLILDEAQNIKNFKSQRWQLLLNFSTERRLLLTGTPLQNDLMELWSLMHFLMPYVFSSHREFKEWFSNPMTGMIEGNMEYNESLISRLHKVIRPFLLRRLKKEVEKQMPKKYEHVVMCRLSNRQRYLYDDFMSRAKTKETLQTGNLLSVINVLMQLRKVCNHPNMFEERPTISPFQMEGISYHTARLICDLMEYDPFSQINLHSLNLLLVQLERTLTAYVSHKSRILAPAGKLIEEVDSMPEPPPRCPTGKYKFHVRVRDPQVQNNLNTHTALAVQVGASPVMKSEGDKLVPLCNANATISKLGKRINNINPIQSPKSICVSKLATGSPTLSSNTSGAENGISGTLRTSVQGSQQPQQPLANVPSTAKIARIMQSGKPYFVVAASNTSVQERSREKTEDGGSNFGNRLTLVCKPSKPNASAKEKNGAKNETLMKNLAQRVKSTTEASEKMEVTGDVADSGTVEEKAADTQDNSDCDPVYNMSAILQQRKEKRLARLKLMAAVNRRRTEAVPIYGSDCRESLERCTSPNQSLKYSTWQTRGYSNCLIAMQRRDNWTLGQILKSHEKRCAELQQMFTNFMIYVPSVCAPRIRFYIQHLTSGTVQCERTVEATITSEICPKLTLLHPIISAMTTQFPDPRLIQYDCGKLQTLDRLLRQLKSEQHRVLIFTQMTKMLDVLEAFLNYHGHIYLRLDGSTRVEQRQVLMERFNGDKRIFCFILSTRSGGVGINLTGADTVIFYDSDWNPTMDAQAQDRCHRIGQTRDVHIYRLVSEKTIEVNILKKANQKRMLSDMAIEGGNFTTSYLKSSTIKDLFNTDQHEQDADASSSVAPAVNKVEKPSTSTTASKAIISEVSSAVESEKQSLRAFETALAAAEDEQDVQATKIAKAEAAADLAEFDETIPIDEGTLESGSGAAAPEISKADLEMQNLVKQLSPIERYAMRFVEETGAAWTAEQLRAAEAEIEAQKREWEANRLAALLKEEEMLKQETEPDEMLTYNRKDANNQTWISENKMEQMPIWCPPTPPQNDNDIYIDYSLSFMYGMECIPESELPPVYVRKDYKRTRYEAGFHLDGNRRPPKIRREDNYFPPRSLFDRPSPAIARIRRDLKNQRYRGVFKPNVQIPGLKPQVAQKTLAEPEGMAEWGIFEDILILHVLVNLQGLPCNLMVLSPGHTPNWDLVSEIVNLQSKTYRSPRQCRWRYETVIQPREEGKLVESPKKQKKSKTIMKSEYLKTPLRCLRTTHMFVNDNNMSFMKLMRSRFDCIKAAYLKRAPPPKRHFSTASLMNPKHMEVLQEFGIHNYDQPISPINIAAMKANKMREKQKSQCPPPPPPAANNQPVPVIPAQSQQPSQTPPQQQAVVVTQQQQQQPQQHQQIPEISVQQQQTVPVPTITATVPTTTSLHTQQLQIQHLPNTVVSGVSQQSTATAIVLQHPSTLQPSHQQQQQSTPVTTVQTQQHIMRSALGTHPSNTQIVKAIVAPQGGLLTAGQMQQLTQQATAATTQHVQLQQSNLGTPSSVSVVLTTPVQTISSNVQSAQHQVTTAQIVSISPQAIVSSATQIGNVVQTLPSQSPMQPMPQVVSVSQLATVGTVLTTSASLQPSATVTTLNTSALRAQRIVTATSGTLQDVVLQQRSGKPSSTIVSMSNLGQGVAAAQFQATHVRLASMPGCTQQVTKVPVGSLQQGNKITSAVGGTSQPAHIQLYRQRQQLKVLQATSAQGNQTLVQTAGGQTALVNAAGAIIQGSIMQAASATAPATVQVQGQKVSVATVSSANLAVPPSSVATSVATVQVAHNQGRAQLIKQMAGKQAIARQVGDNDVVVVKRTVLADYQKAQLLQQGQIFTTTTSAGGGGVQLQQQQVQTSGAAGATVGQQGQAQTQTQTQTQSTQQAIQQVSAQQIATLVKTSGGALQQSGGVTVSTGGGGSGSVPQQGTVNMTLSHLKPGGQIKVTTSMANQPQMRQLHMQSLGMPRKIGRMTQIATGVGQGNVAIASGQQVSTSVAQVSAGAPLSGQKNTGAVQTQLVHIQNTKTLPNSVTVQQIQQVMRQGQPNALAATGLVLSKTSVGRVIPVSVAASQSNQRQTIQVVSAASAQALAAGSLRTHVAAGQNIAGTIKVGTTGGGQSQAQAFINAIQQQRQNASPVRLQTAAGGSLVAVVQQQANLAQQQNVVTSGITSGGSMTNSAAAPQAEVMTISQTAATSTTGVQQPQQQQQQQQQPSTQVRTLMKKKIMQIRSEKE